MWLDTNNTCQLSPLKVVSLDPGLSRTIHDIKNHPISLRTTPEILQNPIARASRGIIHKIEIQAEIVHIFQAVEVTNQDYRQRYCKILLQNYQEVEFIKKKYRQR